MWKFVHSQCWTCSALNYVGIVQLQTLTSSVRREVEIELPGYFWFKDILVGFTKLFVLFFRPALDQVQTINYDVFFLMFQRFFWLSLCCCLAWLRFFHVYCSAFLENLWIPYFVSECWSFFNIFFWHVHFC